MKTGWKFPTSQNLWFVQKLSYNKIQKLKSYNVAKNKIHNVFENDPNTLYECTQKLAMLQTAKFCTFQ